jgi:NAD+ synthase
MSRAERIASWLKERAASAGAEGFVFGLSGGIDSAVVARLCQMATPGKVLGVMLPCHSQPQDEADARLVAEAFELPVVRVDLSSTFDTLTSTLDSALNDQRPRHTVDVVDIKQRLPRANIKPRLRMTSLYFVANAMNYMVAGTGNKSEITLGYYTKYGDGGVDVLPIGGLLKSEVRALARELGVPEPVITKAPTAGLWPGQTDEAEMGFTYEMLEKYLADGASAVPANVAARIDTLNRASAHKRALPPIGPGE